MRVLLVSANTETINMPVLPVGLAAVAAAVESAGHAVELVNLMDVKNTRDAIAEAIAGFRPNAIGVSVRNIDDQAMENTKFLLADVKRIVSECKALSKAPVIVGGAGYSIFPQSCIDYLGADLGLCGEGEKALVAILEKIEKKGGLEGFPGLYLPGKTAGTKPERIQNLDAYPLPRPSLLFKPSLLADENEIWLPVQTRRGCPMKCIYCSTPAIEGRTLRSRNPDRVVESLRSYADAGIKRFYFTDNTFNFPPSYARELCDKIAEARLDVSCRCIVYPMKIDERLVEKMALAGFKEVALGFESGSSKMLKNLRKRFEPKEVRRISEIFGKFGIHRLGFLLLGGPGETRETVAESIEFAQELDLEAVKATAGIRIYPKTELARKAMEKRFISSADDLLAPKFYIEDDLGDWLKATLENLRPDHPNWFI